MAGKYVRRYLFLKIKMVFPIEAFLGIILEVKFYFSEIDVPTIG